MLGNGQRTVQVVVEIAGDAMFQPGRVVSESVNYAESDVGTSEKRAPSCQRPHLHRLVRMRQAARG